jgi:hypothetical protein
MTAWISGGGVDLSRRYDSAYPGVMTTVTKGVLHTTETGSLPGYGNGASAPNATLLWTPSGGMRIFQHFPLDMSARALKNLSGGVLTNTDGVAQFEIVGSCDPGFAKRYGYLYVPDAPDAFYEALAAFMRRVESITSIPRARTPRPWIAYPASYGNSPARMSNSEWDSFRGWCGHQHVAENDHGDPGRLDIDRLIGKPTAVVPRDPDFEVIGEIGVAFRRFGGSRGFLGAPISVHEVACPAPNEFGRRLDCHNGAIWWSGMTGAREVHGAILGRFALARWEGGELGFPLTDEETCPDGRGKYSVFQGGSIYWTPETGAQLVKGRIREKWAALGWESSPLGYPAGEEITDPATGHIAQLFQGGTVVFDPTSDSYVS